MTYFNGNMSKHDFAGERMERVRVSRLYCDDCAETAIPLPATGPNGDGVGRHWHTGFSWAPYYGGAAKCMTCGKPC